MDVGGSFAVVYLAPRDYHRVHAPADGEIRRVRGIRGDLYPVDAAPRATKHNGDGNGDGANETEIQTVVEVADDPTSQSRHILRLSGSPPSSKLLIPLERRDVRVVEGARLEIDSGRAR